MSIIELTNQAGIARGYFQWPQFVRVENRMAELLAAQGVRLDAVLGCPFHPQGQPPYREPDHPWRKPNPGMFLEAAQLLNLDLSQSVVIGDKVSDLEAGRAAGLPLGLLVLTGHGQQHEAASRLLASEEFQVRIAANADQAAEALRHVHIL
jgi:D-glycero-D-manno-heptose 1,7-bisphosphate phosphatase